MRPLKAGAGWERPDMLGNSFPRRHSGTFKHAGREENDEGHSLSGMKIRIRLNALLGDYRLQSIRGEGTGMTEK